MENNFRKVLTIMVSEGEKFQTRYEPDRGK